MLKVIKPGLPHELEDELNTRQENVNAGTVGKTDPWTAFTSYENGREDRGHPTVRAVLREAFSGKCAYCESGDAQTVDHYIPQKPTDANDNRGSDKFTFDWENLLWSCNTCNNKKRSNMEWIDREPKLLNPSKHTDDPLCYFSIDTEFVIGHIQLRGGINEIAHTRASYTIDLLELNNRNDLVKSRYMAVNMFGILIKLLRLDGPDSKTDWGTPLRQTFCEFLASTSPFLAPIRQILCRDNPGLYKELIGSMPELKSVLDTWALPPGDCSHIYDPNADNLREEDVQDEDIIYPKESYERPADYLPRQVMLNNEYTGKDLLAIIKEEKRVVLLGDAGEGKSTELRRIASELSKPGSVYPFHPFFIELDTFVDEKIEDLIPGLHRVPDNARCIIIDGLDQVQSQNRHTAVRRIESYSREHPEVRILVSCRTAFYRTGTETHNATLDGFQVYHFLPIRDHDIEYYIEDKLDDTGSEFIGECIQYDLKDLLENPFYLVELVNLYRIENRIPGWSQLFERLLHSRMRLDREQYRTKIELSDEETKEKIISELEKLAFVMETAGQGVISGSEYRKIISDSETRNLIEHCTVWRGDPSKDRWTFEHNSFREYLAARFLAGNSFDAIKSFTAYGHGPEYTHIKPAWANSLAFLFG
ncbi:MAG: hypothetical protein GY754_00920, partial [bacterium]|nr:hypothetical protein [bacterium]